jgi:RNA polymerase sigma-70 factor (ECF subfamily)
VGVASTTDETLAIAAQSGSAEAAGELFDRHWQDAWRAALAITGSRQLAEDAVQDAFEAAFRAIASYDPDRPFGAWLRRIVVNRSLNALRAERRRTARAASGDTEIAAQERDASGGGLLAAVAHLPPERRVVLVLRYGLDCPLAEIAELLNVPIGTVQSRIHRALAELRPGFEVTS